MTLINIHTLSVLPRKYFFLHFLGRKWLILILMIWNSIPLYWNNGYNPSVFGVTKEYCTHTFRWLSLFVSSFNKFLFHWGSFFTVRSLNPSDQLHHASCNQTSHCHVIGFSCAEKHCHCTYVFFNFTIPQSSGETYLLAFTVLQLICLDHAFSV